jgi:hypothetical protein
MSEKIVLKGVKKRHGTVIAFTATRKEEF